MECYFSSSEWSDNSGDRLKRNKEMRKQQKMKNWISSFCGAPVVQINREIAVSAHHKELFFVSFYPIHLIR